MKRNSIIKRKTSETDIVVELDIDNTAGSAIDTGVPFFDHMLYSMSRHGRFSLNVKCIGDTEIDDHHTVEDTGICIGRAFKEALGGKEGPAKVISIILAAIPVLMIISGLLCMKAVSTLPDQMMKNIPAEDQEEMKKALEEATKGLEQMGKELQKEGKSE